MKRKVSTLIILCVIACLALTACAEESGTFTYTCEDLTLEIPSSCTEISTEAAQNFAFAFSDSKISIMGMREEKSSLPEGADMTPEEYAEQIKIPEDSELTVTNDNGLILMEFDNKVKGLIRKKTFKYMASVYETEDAFWLIQCACLEKEYETSRDVFLSLLTSVNG